MNRFQRNIPNILTILRLAAVPVFIFYMKSGKTFEALVIFLAAEITDVLDGVIARRYDLITTFGKVADPFADKLMQLAALFMLADSRMISRTIPWLVLTLDLFMIISGIYVIKKKKKVDVSSKWFGKLTSSLLFITIVLTFFRVMREITDPLLILSAAMAILSVVMYIRNYFRQVKKMELDTPDTNDD
jgi:cardiolipin synthase